MNLIRTWPSATHRSENQQVIDSSAAFRRLRGSSTKCSTIPQVVDSSTTFRRLRGSSSTIPQVVDSSTAMGGYVLCGKFVFFLRFSWRMKLKETDRITGILQTNWNTVKTAKKKNKVSTWSSRRQSHTSCYQVRKYIHVHKLIPVRAYICHAYEMDSQQCIAEL